MSAYATSLDFLGEHVWVLMPVKGILLSNTSMDALKLVTNYISLFIVAARKLRAKLTAYF